MSDLNRYTAQKMTEMVDLPHPSEIEIKIRGDGKVVWVNVDGICRFRAKVSKITLIDERSDIASELSKLLNKINDENLHKEGE